MKMDKQRWQQIESIYHAALEREPDERAVFLADACAGDSDLRREVEELLRHDGAAVPLFEFRDGTVGAITAPYAVTADGQRFLINTVVETEPNAPLTVVVNWAAELKK